jgi:hypothetical protein
VPTISFLDTRTSNHHYFYGNNKAPLSIRLRRPSTAPPPGRDSMIELRLQKTNRWAKAPPIDSSPSNRNSVCLGSTLKKAQRKRLGDGNAAAIAAGRFRQSASDIRMRVRLWCPQAFPPLRILACRHCHGAAYASQQRDRNGRKRLAASKLRPKLGGCPDIRDNAVTPQNPPSQLQRNPSPSTTLADLFTL